MKKIAFLAATLLASLAANNSAATAASYKLPPETAALLPGAGHDVAVANCSGCHSADYISTQPRGEKFRADFWKAEVNKMIKVYGAPIDESDVPKIVEYLTETYGDSNLPAATTPTTGGGKPAKLGSSASR